MKIPNYEIVRDVAGEPLLIRDLGGLFPSITNGAEHVVEQLASSGRLPLGRRLFYEDSDRNLNEILVINGRFVGFAQGPGRESQP